MRPSVRIWTPCLFPQSKERVLALYEKVMEGTHHLYNGSEYMAYEPLDEEHPYYLSENWILSDVKYDGEWFRNVPILYDLARGTLITAHYYTGSRMELIDSSVDEFIIQDHHFLNVSPSRDTFNTSRGIYELLHDGRTDVLSKRFKKISERIEGTEVMRAFIESDAVFVVKSGNFRRITFKNDLWEALKDKKKELKNYSRNQGLFKLTNNKEYSIIALVKYYDSLSK